MIIPLASIRVRFGRRIPDRVHLLRILYLLLAACCLTPAWACAAPHYEARFDADSKTMSVRACLAGAQARVKFVADSAAMRFLSNVRRDSDGAGLHASTDGWSARDWRAGECLAYRADLAAMADSHDEDVGWRVGQVLVSAPQLWLLRTAAESGDAADIRLTMPENLAISAPWHELEHSANTYRFRIPNTPPTWSAAVAIGPLDEQRITVPGGTLRIAIPNSLAAQEREKLQRWMVQVAQASVGAYGRLPIPDVQILMLPVDELSLPMRLMAFLYPQAVLGGESARGEGNALQLIVDPARVESEFIEDWTAVHELSHQMHPYLGDRGSWLSEGLATYYQNILRARAGLLTPPQAWDRLQAGFQRGALGMSGATLEQAAANMQRDHSYLRVYWAGTAYWLAVDRDLRRSSGGKYSLDLALSRFSQCCLPAYRLWQPQDFVAKLDALLGVQTFSQRYREFSRMKGFPDWQKLYAELGIRDAGEHVAYDGNAVDAVARDAIMAAPPASASALK